MAAGAPKMVKVPKVPGIEVIKVLGRGANGVVFKARQQTMDRLVAVKILSPRLAGDERFMARFIREARTSAKLNHPNIVQGYDVGQVGQSAYFIMEFIDGQSMGASLRQGAMDWREVVRIGAQVASALEHASSVGMIHRDIKPDNILLAADGQAKLVDLGLAKSITADVDAAEPDQVVDAAAAGLTQAGAVLGTPHYIAPEQARGESRIDIRADIYSLGATLYHAMTGHVMFAEPSAGAAMRAHATDTAPSPRKFNPEIPESVCQVLAKMTAKSPEDRYDTPEQARRELKAALSGRMAPQAQKFHAASSIATRARRQRSAPQPAAAGSGVPSWVWMVAASVVVVVVLLAMMGGPRTKPTAAAQAPSGTAAPPVQELDPPQDLVVPPTPPAENEPQEQPDPEGIAKEALTAALAEAIASPTPFEAAASLWRVRGTVKGTQQRARWQSALDAQIRNARTRLEQADYAAIRGLQSACAIAPLQKLWQQQMTRAEQEQWQTWRKREQQIEQAVADGRFDQAADLVDPFLTHPVNEIAAAAKAAQTRVAEAQSADQQKESERNALDMARYRLYRDILPLTAESELDQAVTTLRQWQRRSNNVDLGPELSRIGRELEWLRETNRKACRKLAAQGASLRIPIGRSTAKVKAVGEQNGRLEVSASGLRTLVPVSQIPLPLILEQEPWRLDSTTDQQAQTLRARYLFWRKHWDQAAEAIAPVTSADADVLRERLELLRNAATKLFVPPKPQSFAAKLPDDFGNKDGMAPAGATAAPVSLSWQTPSDAPGRPTEYRLERGLAEAPFAPLVTLTPNQQSYTDAEAPLDSQVRYRLRAINDKGEAEAVAELQTPARRVVVVEKAPEPERPKKSKKQRDMERLMRLFDDDGNGVLTRNEVPRDIRRFFDFGDKNNDGVIDVDEMVEGWPGK